MALSIDNPYQLEYGNYICLYVICEHRQATRVDGANNTIQGREKTLDG